MRKRTVASMRRRKQMLYLYMTFLIIWSMSIAIMPIGSLLREKSKLPMYFAGATFWVGAIGTIWILFKINHYRKHCDAFKKQKRKLGLVYFFQNKEAVIVDLVMFLAIVGLIASKVWNYHIFITFIMMALFVFTFGMHCMLNGVNYRYIKYNDRRNKEDEAHKNKRG